MYIYKMKESTLHQKLENIVSAGKPKTIKINGKNIYILKKKIIECEKEGGILPLITLIPLIAGGVSAAGGVAGAAEGVIAKAVNDKKAADEELAEQRRHNLEMEKKTGGNLEEHIKNFAQALPIANEAKEAVEEFLVNISDVAEVKKPNKEGNRLYLNPPPKI